MFITFLWVGTTFFFSFLRKSTFSKRRLVNGWLKGGGICIIICQLKGCNSEQKKLHVTVMNFATSNFTPCRLLLFSISYLTLPLKYFWVVFASSDDFRKSRRLLIRKNLLNLLSNMWQDLGSSLFLVTIKSFASLVSCLYFAMIVTVWLVFVWDTE